MKGAECAERNGKNNNKNSPIFVFRVIIENWGDFFTKMTITRKIEIGKIWNFLFFSIQPIADLTCKFKKKKLFWTKSMILFAPRWFCPPPLPLTGAAPLDPACFWIEDCILTGLRSTAFKEFACYSVFMHNSKNKNRKNLKFGFSFYSTDSRSFMSFLKKKIGFWSGFCSKSNFFFSNLDEKSAIIWKKIGK